MKYAICNETFQDWPLKKAFAFAAECGYTGLEIAPFTLAADARQITPEQRSEVRNLAERASLEIIGLHWLLAKTSGYYLTSPDPAIRRRTADYLIELTKLCRDLGGHVMVFGSPQQRNLLPGVTQQQAYDHAAEVFRAVAPTLEECHVTLAVEPLGPAEGDFLTTAAAAMQLIKMVDSPRCRLHLDCKAMASESKPIPELIRENKLALEHFHANDPNRQGPGFGELDFVPIMKTLEDINYRRWVSVEVFDYTPGIERLAQESIDYMRGCLEKEKRS